MYGCVMALSALINLNSADEPHLGPTPVGPGALFKLSVFV